MTLTVSLQVWRQHCSPLAPKNRVFSEAKTFESWSLATPRSKSLAVLSLCHNSTSRGNLKQRSDFSVRHQHKKRKHSYLFGRRTPCSKSSFPNQVMVTIVRTMGWLYCLSLRGMRLIDFILSITYSLWSDYHSFLQLLERTMLQWKWLAE